MQSTESCVAGDFTAHEHPTFAISVIVPVFDGAATLGACLERLGRSLGPVSWECIVVDDGSTDGSAEIAASWNARLVRTGGRFGPAYARTCGARVARAPLLCFVDADVLVGPTTLHDFFLLFQADPDLVAAFGSYDAVPTAPGLPSQYRNLLHHYVHQSGHEEASTFWAGCGSIRRNAFFDIGGFDRRYTRPSIEDIELGHRLHASGARIKLAKHIQVTHMKRWGVWGIIRTDIRDRALPWSALIARTRHLPNDLNLDWPSRVSAASVYALVSMLVLGWWIDTAWVLASVPLLALFAANHRLYRFFLHKRGAWFLVRVLPLHWLYLFYSAAVFGGCILFETVTRKLEASAPHNARPTGPGVPLQDPPHLKRWRFLLPRRPA